MLPSVKEIACFQCCILILKDPYPHADGTYSGCHNTRNASSEYKMKVSEDKILNWLLGSSVAICGYGRDFERVFHFSF